MPKVLDKFKQWGDNEIKSPDIQVAATKKAYSNMMVYLKELKFHNVKNLELAEQIFLLSENSVEKLNEMHEVLTEKLNSPSDAKDAEELLKRTEYLQHQIGDLTVMLREVYERQENVSTEPADATQGITYEQFKEMQDVWKQFEQKMAVKFINQESQIKNAIQTQMFEHRDEVRQVIEAGMSGLGAEVQGAVADGMYGVNTEVKDAVAEGMDGLNAEVKGAVAESMSGISAEVKSAVNDSMSEVQESVKAAIDNNVAGLSEVIKNAMDQNAAGLGDAVKSTMSDNMSGLDEAIKGAIEEGITSYNEELKYAVNDAMATHRDIIKRTVDSGLATQGETVSSAIKEEMSDFKKEVADSLREDLAEYNSNVQGMSENLQHVFEVNLENHERAIKKEVSVGREMLEDSLRTQYNSLLEEINNVKKVVKGYTRTAMWASCLALIAIILDILILK